MKCSEAIVLLKDLKMLRSIYENMQNRSHETLYSKRELSRLINMTNEEIYRITDLMLDMELEDSYDQNTGKVHLIYKSLTEEEKLLKVCGGPKSETKQ